MTGLYIYDCPTCNWMVGSHVRLDRFFHASCDTLTSAMSESEELLSEPQIFENHEMVFKGWFINEIARPMIEARQRYVREKMYAL